MRGWGDKDQGMRKSGDQEIGFQDLLEHRKLTILHGE